MDIRLNLTFGQDRGQPWGSLFEARNADDQIVAGAGFANVYNTCFANDRFTLQFYLRDLQGNRPTFTPLPRPTTDAGAYLFDLHGQLHAKALVGTGQPSGWFVMNVELARQGDEKQLQVWDPAKKRWHPSPRLDGRRMRIGDGMMCIGPGLLTWVDSRVEFDGQLILPPPSKGFYHHFHYAHGHLFFVHCRPGRIDLHACPYEPQSARPLDLEQSIPLSLSHDREFPLAIGQWQDHLLICTNIGGTYRFAGGQWQVLRRSNGKSYQIYSALNFKDRLLLAHYPSGHLLEYTGDQIVEMPDAPPRLQDVSAAVREAQTTILYGGYLYVGVWPWAELWRMDEQTGQWEWIDRLFSHPTPEADFDHPYERAIRALNAGTGAEWVHNGWGQRITSMVPLADSLMIGTSAKWNWSADTPSPFLTPRQRAEYGRILKMRHPYVLSAPVQWKPHPTEIRLVADGKQMRILQDERLLAQRDVAPFPPDLAAHLSQARPILQAGGFGPFGGTDLRMTGPAEGA